MAKSSRNSKKSNKPVKPQVHVRFSRVLVILAGANLVLMFAPGIGMLHSMYYIGSFISLLASLIGIALVIYAFQSLYYTDEKKR